MTSKSDRFPKKQRLAKRREFKAVENEKFRSHGRYVIVCVALNHLGYPRIGITVTKKVGNAVKRNHWKRRIRESFRTNDEIKSLSVDIVVIVRFQVGKEPPPPFHELKNDVAVGIQRAVKKCYDASSSSENDDISSTKQLP